VGVACEIYLARLARLRPAHFGVLDDAEQRRAAAYRQAGDRDRFALGAALLRIAAGHILGAGAASIPVDRTCADCGQQHGRPMLPGTGLHVSVAHSADLVAVALTRAGPVGVDVEVDAAGPAVLDKSGLDKSGLDAIGLDAIGLDAIGLACGPTERTQVRSRADFLTFWTRKEAVLKATGEGLRRPMTDLVVTPPGTPPALVAVAARQPPPCQLADIPCPDDYLGAAAVLTASQVVFTAAECA
jgi:4'-phosphopantetheinyl transferase